MKNVDRLPVSIYKWGLDKKNLLIVKDELGKWLNLFIRQADGRTGNVYRCDFVADDFFYFTDCKDKVSKNVESRAVETSMDIRRRKDKVFLQLLIRSIIGNIDFIPLGDCTHCGYSHLVIDTVTNGHVVYCGKCKKIDLCVYSDSMEYSFNDIRKKIWELERLDEEKND